MADCDICGKTIESAAGLAQHRADAHGVRNRPWGKYVAVAAVVVGLIGGIAWLFSGQPPAERVEHYAGNPQAAVTIVEYSDFQCPACGAAYPIVEELMSKYPDKVKFVYRHFPLANIHPFAEKAAEAAECAGEEGKFWEMYRKMFENQGALTPADLKGYARGLGLGSSFDSCLDSGRMASRVQADFNGGISAGVRATPTFFINGVKYEGVQPLATFERAIGVSG